MSCAYRRHATCHLAHSLFEQHDATRFELFAYAATPPDLAHEQVQAIARHSQLVDLGQLSDYEAALRIQRDEIDILVDLDGHIESNRHMIAAYRPAPVQVNYLGFPGTSGAPWIDYLIGDYTVTPPGSDTEFTEHVVRLPDCYQFNNFRALDNEAVPARAQLNLPEQAVVYCCFNIGRKIEPEVFACWMEILNQVPEGVLWFVSDGDAMQANLKNQASAAGIASERLIFAERVPATAHLARQRCADLFLDTFYCSAHTTASDALWAGLPVLTCEGSSFANRVAASIVRAAGLTDCVLASPTAYQAKAIELGKDASALKSLKNTLAQSIDNARLFDSATYARHLESAYHQMWNNQLSGKHQAIELKSDDQGY